ncbi:MAG: amino acid permease [Acidobacteriota bacterium]|jgi:L-asparagine transporter-like permease
MSAPIASGKFEDRESGLKRELSVRLLGMIAIGQSIGTGLFLGSGISAQMAGPAVILSYAIGALITYAVMLALSEMTTAHPAAGSFGVYAEHYLGPWAGIVTRYTYSMAQIVAIGGQIVAVAIYCRFWLPDIPSWIWITGFSIALLAINVLHVGSFGEAEYWFSLIKVLAICFLLIFGVVLFAGIGVPRQGLAAYTSHGGFFPHGVAGVWAAVTMAVFSFYGLEAAAVGSGETRDPRTSVPKALRRIMARLSLFYIGSMIILVGIVPWNETGIGESPFVLVYRRIGIPGAAGLMNLVVLTAALTSINANLYTSSRMIFSLARSGQAPASLGKLSAHGVPRNAVLISGVGLGIAAMIYWFFADTAYVYMLGISLFGAIFCWFMILATHVRFRETRIPYGSVAGMCVLLAVLATMAFLPEMRVAWIAGPPWLLLISALYFRKYRARGQRFESIGDRQ